MSSLIWATIWPSFHLQELGQVARRLRMFYGIVTSAYGIGEGFYEEVMIEIAANGGGRYAFVDDQR